VNTIKADPAELITTTPSKRVSSDKGVWHTIRGFILWSHERGTVQYDVMVTLILVFLFFSPRVINFNDRPVERNPHPTGVVVSPDGTTGNFVYDIDAKAVKFGDDAAVEAQLLRIIEPISGEISISRFERVKDKKGNVSSYKVWASRD
jgi:hypothetical protein